MLTNEGTWESKEKGKMKANNAKFKQNMFSKVNICVLLKWKIFSHC
jgi:hypothetical protein